MRLFARGLFAVAALSLTACPAPPQQCVTGDEDACDDAGTLPPDACNSKDEALSSADCSLTLGTRREAFITSLADGGADQDWYSATLPSNLTARSLLHVNAGYSVPQTAVNFQVNVLDEAGKISLVTGVDAHGAAAPKPVDLILPYDKSGSKILVLVGDQGQGPQVRVDNRNPYHVMVEVIDNPDVNEPNDTSATAIPLAPSGGLSTGAASGWLSTTDDVDRFSFQVGSGGRQIIYLHVSTAAGLTNPPLPYLLGYTLFDPTGTPVSEGHMDKAFAQVDLSTARLAASPGTYTLAIAGFKPSGSTLPVKGDLRPESKYSVDVRLMPDVDTTEPNDTKATARVKTMSLGGTQTIAGRLSYVGDEEWFQLNVPASSQETALRYAFHAGTTGGRFPPTFSIPSRNLRITTDVTGGANAQDNQVQCKTNATVCPKGYEADIGKQQLVESVCMSLAGPQCLWSERLEDSRFARQKNLVGAIPVPARSGSTSYFLMFRDQGVGLNKYADDLDYTLEVTWEPKPADATASPVSLGASTAEVTGHLSYGHGRLLEPFDVNSGTGVRGPDDYDAVQTETDPWTFDLPGTGDQGWSVSWALDVPDGGTTPPADVTLELAFCNGAPGSCTTIKRVMAYSADPLTPWYLPQSFANASTLFTRTASPGQVTVTAQPIGCWCVPAAFAASGSFGVNVGAVNRLTNDPLTYHLRQALSAYPTSYTGDGGVTISCPSSADAGCGFGL